jgi:hypothetical protein
LHTVVGILKPVIKLLESYFITQQVFSELSIICLDARRRPLPARRPEHPVIQL